MLSISRSVKVLILAVLCGFSLSVNAEVAKREVVAKVGIYDITRFEINSFINKILPIGAFHKTSVNKKEYADKALQESIYASYLLLHIQKHQKGLFQELKEQAEADVAQIQAKVKSEASFQALLAQNSITLDDLMNTRMKLAVKDQYKQTYMEISRTENKLKTYYETHPNMFMTGVSMDIQSCLIKADARELSVEEMKQKSMEAQAFRFKLLEGEAQFDDAACDVGLFPKDHRLYRFSKGYPVQKIMALSEGETSMPMKSIYGFLIVKVVTVHPSEQLPYEEVKGQIEDIMKRKAFQTDYRQIIKEMKDEVVVHMFIDTPSG